MAKNWLDEEFEQMAAKHVVDKSGYPSPRPWTFKHAPVIGAIDNHQIQAANGRYMGSAYTYADAKLICDLANG